MPVRKSLITGSAMRRAVNRGNVKKEKTGRTLAMKASLFVAHPRPAAGPQPHHSTALTANRIVIA
jgi:hypothetical protein